MSIDKKSIDKFYQENKHLLEQKIIEYPINEENFLKWIDSYQTDDLKSLASLLRKYTKYVSYNEFTSKIASICAGIRAQHKSYNRVILCMNNKLNKSNFWTSFLVYSFLKDIITEIAIDSFDNIMNIKEEDKVLGIICDDTSYSGNQLKVLMGKIPKDFTVYMVVPYISTIAQSKLKKVSDNIFFPSEIEVFKPFNENIAKDKIGNISARKIAEKYKLPIKFSTIYFSHKLADMVSIFQTIYSFGFPFSSILIDKKYFKYQPLSLVKNCDLPKEFPNILPTDNIYDIQDLTGVEKMCPKPFYKLFKYKYNNEEIKDLYSLIAN